MMNKSGLAVMILSVLYLMFRWIRQTDYCPGWVSGYATDLICMPLVLLLIMLIIRQIPWYRTFVPTPAMVMVLTIQFSLCFEWILPKMSPVYTADPIDTVCYFVGAIVFLLLMKKPLISS